MNRESRLRCEHGDKRLEPLVQLLHLLRHGGLHVSGGCLDALLDVLGGGLDLLLHVLHLRPQQVVQGAHLCLGIVTHLGEVRVETGLHFLHVV